MVITKEKVVNIILVLFLIVFPFGQIVKISVINPVDIIAGLALIIFLLKPHKKLPPGFRYFQNILIIFFFSLLFSLTRLGLSQIQIGSLYFLRLLSYVAFYILVWEKIRLDIKLKQTLFNALILISFFTAIFGWIQYLWLPDLRALKLLGWDDHYFRLVGTFLDPGFEAIIVCFGALLTLVKYLYKPRKSLIFIFIYFVVTLAFTYSRAGYVSLIAGLITLILIFRNKFKIILFYIIFFLFLLPLLPRPQSAGVELERTFSITSRFKNYQDTLNIFKLSPVFGIGFNNLCITKINNINNNEAGSHACSGSDSSLLLILATSGVIGLIIFIDLINAIKNNLASDIYSLSLKVIFVALIINSLFINSFFYSWVLGFMAILTALAVKSKD